MDSAALSALRSWQPDVDTKNVSICPATSPRIHYDGKNKSSFTARAQFELPDGGRFHVLLSASLSDESKPVEPLTAIVEDGLGLPDGFLIDINTYLFGDLNDGHRQLLPGKLLQKVLKHASHLFCKLVSDHPQPVSQKETESDDHSVKSSPPSFSAKRKRNAATNYKDPVFRPSKLATTTLMKQLSLLQGMDTRRDGFTANPITDNLYKWVVLLYFDNDNSSTIATDLARLPGHEAIELEFRFPSEYPYEPPMVRVVAPHVVGGHVAPHGGICMELLTTSGWAPVNSIDVVCIQIRTMLVQGNARIDVQKLHRVANYTFEGALKDLRNIVRMHNWHVADSSRKRPRS